MTDIQEQQTAPIVTDDVADIRAALIRELTRTLNWRSDTAIAFPEDSRNQRAIQIIQRMIETVPDVNPTLLLKFDDIDENQQTDDPWDHYRKALGFKYSPGSCTELLLAFCADPGRFVVRWQI